MRTFAGIRVAALAAAVVAFPAASGMAQAGLLGFYPFNGNANDASGNGNNGVVTGSPTYVSGAPFGGQAIQFDGASNSFVTVPIDISVANLSQVTFGGWFNSSVDSGGIRGVVSNDDGNFDRTIDVDTRPGGFQWSIFIGGNVVGNGQVTKNTWTFVVARYDQTTNSYAFNVDGSQISGTTNFDADSVTTGTTIGRNPNFDSPFAGQMADVFFYDQYLSDVQINAIRANGPSAITGASTVPEPASLALVGGFLLLGGFLRRRVAK